MNLYKAAVIGLGNIGLMYDFDPKRIKPASHSLTYAWNSGIDYVAAMDVRVEQQESLYELSKETLFFTSLKEMLQSCKFDVISICTPPANHYSDILEIFKYSMQPPRIIFCEKPIVSTVDQYQEIKRLLDLNGTLLIPNFIRRWSSGFEIVDQKLQNKQYGELLKIHIRYTRGILNTGSHLFDLIKRFAGEIHAVRTLYAVNTSADSNEPSYTFAFTTHNAVTGFAEAFDDKTYYLFELDLYFEKGKIEIKNSGDTIEFYSVQSHPLFSGLNGLELEFKLEDVLQESTFENAAHEIIDILNGNRIIPSCTIDDGIYPILVANALIRSYENNSSLEKVVFPSG